MLNSQPRKAVHRPSSLTVPELEETKRSILNTLISPHSRRSYATLQHSAEYDPFVDPSCTEPTIDQTFAPVRNWDRPQPSSLSQQIHNDPIPGILLRRTTQWGDGPYSFSQHRRGMCGHHGGVGKWL
jgi:hypothetical protein